MNGFASLPFSEEAFQHGNSLFVAGKMRVISNGRLPPQAILGEPPLTLAFAKQGLFLCFLFKTKNAVFTGRHNTIMNFAYLLDAFFTLVYNPLTFLLNISIL